MEKADENVAGIGINPKNILDLCQFISHLTLTSSNIDGKIFYWFANGWMRQKIKKCLLNEMTSWKLKLTSNL